MGKFGSTSTAEDVTAGVDLTGQNWLVTGCNSGLGYETMRVLGMRGAKIYGLARTRQKAETAITESGVQGVAVECELSELDSVGAAVTSVAGVKLDGVIANAGIMALQTLEQKNGVELQFLTNHIGHSVLIDGLIPQVTPGGRIVVLSSGAHRFAKRGLELDNISGEDEYDPWRAYGRSKLANIVYTRELADRFADDGSNRKANAVHPGVIRTNLSRHIPDADGMFARMDNIKSIAEGAATQCYVAIHPEAAKTNGKYFSDCKIEEARLPEDMARAVAELRAITDKTIQKVNGKDE